MAKTANHSSIGYLTRIAAITAIIVILTVFNIGNIPVGPIVATIYQVPVIIGAVILGPAAGALLGGIWGVLCFYLAVTGQTTDVVALTVVQQNVMLYFLIAFVPRLLMGLLSGLLYKAMSGMKYKTVAYGITGAVGSLLNTAFYLGALYLFIKDILASLFGIELGAVGAMVMGVATTNGLVEAGISCIIVLAVCKALSFVTPEIKRERLT